MRHYLDIDLATRTVESPRTERAGIRRGRPLFHRQDPAEGRRRQGRSAVAGQSADLLSGSLRRHQLLQRQPALGRLQEPADRRDQGIERRRHLCARHGPSADRRLHPAQRLGRLGRHPYRQGRRVQLGYGRALHGQGQYRGCGPAAREIRQENQRRPVQPGRRISGAARRHRGQRRRESPGAARGARRRRRGHGHEKGQGDRRRQDQNAPVARPPEGDGRDQGIRRQAARAAGGPEHVDLRHRHDGRLHQHGRRPAGAQFQRGQPSSIPRRKPSRPAATSSTTRIPSAAAIPPTPACPAA